MEYKIPLENSNYPLWSRDVIEQISLIFEQALTQKQNLIFIQTNLKRGLPLENINKVAGPFVEAWAFEQFENIYNNAHNVYQLINIQAGKRLDPFDIILQFKRSDTYISANVDVKATSEDIKTSGLSPNITSYARIRSEYVRDADLLFIILSLKHKVYGERDTVTGLTNGIMEIVSYAVYDLKYVAANDLSYNPALGTGQLQIRDIHYVRQEQRSTWEFCQLIDQKFIKSKGEAAWLKLAQKNQWIKDEL